MISRPDGIYVVLIDIETAGVIEQTIEDMWRFGRRRGDQLAVKG